MAIKIGITKRQAEIGVMSNYHQRRHCTRGVFFIQEIENTIFYTKVLQSNITPMRPEQIKRYSSEYTIKIKSQ